MRIALFSLMLLLPVGAAPASNGSLPIILVHGFGGWGPGEMLGLHYWGGLSNFAEKLNREHGADVREAVVGPISSNWDRACELYAYIQGGRVDYGQVHSMKYGHERYGRTFPGLYTDWGPGSRAIDLVGHSMGGQTIRLLLQLLVEGDEGERGQGGLEKGSLFAGGRRGWVRSLNTINTPHDGTTAVSYWPKGFKDLVKSLVKGFASVQGVFGNALPYDFKLDQWGLERRQGEGFLDYEDRVFNSSVWATSNEDFSDYDLSTEGAAVMNGIAAAQPEVYYTSYASVDTYKAVLGEHQVPKATMWFFLQPLALVMGGAWEEKWWQNDGVVNTVSESGPKVNSSDSIVVYDDGKPTQPGVWNAMPVVSGVDHIEMVGIGVQTVYPIYAKLVERLRGLPLPGASG